jgi:hypothetical protein
VRIEHIKEIFSYYISMNSVYFCSKSACYIETDDIDMGLKLNGSSIDGMVISVQVE